MWCVKYAILAAEKETENDFESEKKLMIDEVEGKIVAEIIRYYKTKYNLKDRVDFICNLKHGLSVCIIYFAKY